MPKRRKKELVQSQHFSWLLGRRRGIWQADGRSNPINVGRHSLGTNDRTEALKLLSALDAVVAANHGLAPMPTAAQTDARTLSLEAGRNLYEAHIKRPRVAGGVRTSTQKKYRSVFDKFLPFATANKVLTWNAVTTEMLHHYAADLDRKGYAGTSVKKELITLIQCLKWLVQEKHLVGVVPLRLKLRKVESERGYCYTPEQVQAMLELCNERTDLEWLKRVIIALACTGFRIAELASLTWTDVDLANDRLSLTDESGRSTQDKNKRRELKSGRSRGLPLHPDLKQVLTAIPRVDNYVFRGPRNGRLKPDTVRRILIREVIKPLRNRFPSTDDEQGFKDGRLHSFRHYFASMCGNRGVPERVVMEWLGHKDSEMVRHYYHLHDTESRQQMSKLNLLGTADKRPVGKSNQRAAQNEPEDPPSPTEFQDNGGLMTSD